MVNKANLRICLAISIFFLAIAGLAQAATITVGPGAGYDFETIQEGIDATVDGDTVLVAPGEYVITEPVTFRGKAITFRSEAGPDETTIRMGTPADTNRGSVVVFENNETDTSILDGFTITGGTGSWVSPASAYAGGGIYFDASSGTIRNCAIVQNTAEYGGGVLCAYPCTPRLIDCTITKNVAEEDGGGVFTWSGASLTLTNSTIRGNSAQATCGGVEAWDNSSMNLINCVITENTAGSSGGAVVCSYNSLATLTDCIIAQNSSTTLAGGGLLCWDNSSVTMTNCTIAENSAETIGGGLMCGENSSSVTMTHCEIVGNTAGLGGGGLEIWHQASATVINCVIAQNTTAAGGGIICAPYGYAGCSVTVTNSIIWGNDASQGRQIRVNSGGTLDITYSNVAGGQTGVSVEGGSTLNWGESNIDADPLFADPNNDDFHLKSQAGRWNPNSQTWVLDDVMSLCIDAGDPNSDWTAELWPHGERINMGAYGGTLQASRSLSDAGNIADLNRDGIVDSADMRIMVDHWGTDEPLCDIGPTPFGDGIVDVQDLVVLAENLFEEVPPIE